VTQAALTSVQVGPPVQPNLGPLPLLLLLPHHPSYNAAMSNETFKGYAIHSTDNYTDFKVIAFACVSWASSSALV
jgi:hypothetical protein